VIPQRGQIEDLSRFIRRHPRLFVLTGAGISTASGIPDYRDANGDWKRPPPVQHHDFVHSAAVRQRYWARSLIGWQSFARARPNVCHATLAAWEAAGQVSSLITQNVDGLHQAAGSTRVVDLHGRLDQVVCLQCAARSRRGALQQRLTALNPQFAELGATPAPDGDAELDLLSFQDFHVPDCPECGGTLKPDVVFFGETIPRERVERAVEALYAADALLVIGSSLMVYSGFRFCRLAAERGMPLAAITPGRTRADDLLDLKLGMRFEDVITELEPAALEP